MSATRSLAHLPTFHRPHSCYPSSLRETSIVVLPHICANYTRTEGHAVLTLVLCSNSFQFNRCQNLCSGFLELVDLVHDLFKLANYDYRTHRLGSIDPLFPLHHFPLTAYATSRAV